MVPSTLVETDIVLKMKKLNKHILHIAICPKADRKEETVDKYLQDLDPVNTGASGSVLRTT